MAAEPGSGARSHITNVKNNDTKRAAGFCAALLVALLMVVSRPALAAITIGWDDLVPPMDNSLNPYQRLSPDQQYSLAELWAVRQRNAAGSTNGDMDDLEEAAIANLAAGGFDAEKLLRELNDFVTIAMANNYKLVEELNGTNVRIAGYVLPTEFSGDKVVEFLLVPYVGACVHTPPPPANQMVYVKVDEGFANAGLFAGVWVTGTISAAMSTQSISFTDGAADVEAGYQIKASDISPYD